jgi:parallel beta-helix repeat protein
MVIKDIYLRYRGAIITTFALFSFMIIVYVVIFYGLSTGQRYMMMRNPIGYKILANWHSLRKIVNIVHLPYWFKDSQLEIYTIVISPNNTQEMNNYKPVGDDGLTFGRMFDDLKHYVNAYFVGSQEYIEEIDIRYRGIQNNNWDAEKTAFRIKFPKENLFQGQRSLNLFLPYDRGFFIEPLNSHRADKLGVFSAEFEFVRAMINGRDLGVYLASEPWSKEFLAKQNIMDSNNIFSNKDIDVSEEVIKLSMDRLSDWKSYTAEIEEGPFEELAALLTLIDKADEQEFANKISTLVNLEEFYAWHALNVLAGSSHQSDNSNSVLLFRQETGRFELASWDVNIDNPDHYTLEKTNILARRILANQHFFEESQKVLSEYVEDENNLVDDLKFYDDIYERMKPEFYNDQAKLYNDFMFDDTIVKYRDWLIGNFANAKEIASLEQTPFTFHAPESSGEIDFQGSFKYLNDVSLSLEQFLVKHPQFIKYDQNTVWLPGGSHIFRETVVVPQGLKLEIRPGARLFFDEGVSMISYSPVEAKGNKHWPIIMKPLAANRPWGSFAVVNVEQENIFEYLELSGGSNDLINGTLLTSQFSLHNTKSIINYCTFSNSQSDDAFHAILGSVNISDSIFKNNMADAIDVDYVQNSYIMNSFFDNDQASDHNGDAIDLSGVDDFFIMDNDIRNHGDKCISVGEAANLDITNNIISGCNIGIAVKDNSRVVMDNNIIIGNHDSGLSLYRKKQEFISGGEALLQDSILWGNQEQLNQDELSNLEIKDSIIQGEQEQPDFQTLLPKDLYLLYQDKL